MPGKHSLHDIEQAEKTAVAAARLAGPDLGRQCWRVVHRRQPDAHVHERRRPDHALNLNHPRPGAFGYGFVTLRMEGFFLP